MHDDKLPQSSLAEIVTPVCDKAFACKRSDMPYVGLEHLAGGSPYLLGTAKSAESTSTNSVFQKGDILFGKLRPYLKKSILATFSGYCSTDLLVLRPTEGVDPIFAARVFQSNPVFARAVATSIGTKMPRTSWAALRQLSVFTPRLTEQRRIAEILDSVDETIRKTEQAITKLQQMKRGLLHDLLTRGIDENGELRDPERHPEQFQDSPLGRVPKGWNVRPLGEVLLRAEYGISEALSDQGAVPVLRMMNLADGEAELSDLKFSDAPKAHGLLLREGDVLFNRTNSFEHVGRTGIWREQLPNASFASYLVRLVPTADLLSPEFLNRWLNWGATQLSIRRWATPGVHQVNINPTSLRRTLMALPRSIGEQEAICNALMQQDETMRAEARTLAKLRALKIGLMGDLLTGRVRVPVPQEVNA